MTVTVVNYGAGNLGSVMNMLRKLRVSAQLADSPQEVARADKVLLPGVGAFDRAMQRIRDTGLDEALHEAAVERAVPVLGICLGMHLLTRNSEEGVLSGFGWLDASTVRFDPSESDDEIKVPHMGWNLVEPRQRSRLLPSNGEQRFYFAHSYHVECDHQEDVIGVTSHGYEFPSVIGRGNIMGAQFHPEKSHRFGQAMLKNFAELY